MSFLMIFLYVYIVNFDHNCLQLPPLVPYISINTLHFIVCISQQHISDRSIPLLLSLVGARDANPGPHVCIEKPFTHRTNPPSPLSLLCLLNCLSYQDLLGFTDATEIGTLNSSRVFCHGYHIILQTQKQSPLSA